MVYAILPPSWDFDDEELFRSHTVMVLVHLLRELE